MSLTDAFLLDPQKLDIWIALRTDGAKGSGTESDPYDGSTRATPIISVSSISGSVMTATATASNHGFKNGDRVLIAGATGGDSRYYNGTFSISNVAANTFQYTMRGTPQNSPATGTITCRLDPYQLDAVMSSVPASPPATVHIGPGLFETKGFSPYVTGGWQPKSGQKIIGSGIGVTILKLVGAPVPNVTYWAIGTAGYLDSFEASDFTVDCNLGGQSLTGFTFPPITCGALSVPVSHTRFRRIRAINFGTLDAGLECFVMVPTIASVGVQEAVDCVIEDCILEQPAINNHGIITVILMASGERSTDGFPAFHRACVIRNCVIDCEYRDNPVPISGITINVMSGIATVTTTLPHGRANGNWVRISGAILNGTTNNSFNGSYTISNVTTYGFTYAPNPTQTPNPTGEMWVDRFSSNILEITSLTRQLTNPGTNEWTVTIITSAPHFRVPGGNVAVELVETVQNHDTTKVKYNGSFKVEDDSPWDPKKLKYKIISTADPGDWYPSGLVGAFFQAVSADGGTAAAVEGNRIWNTRIGGPYHDTWNTKDMIVRSNHYRAVVTGPYQLLGGPLSISGAGLAIPLSSLDHIGAAALAVTNTPHGLNSNELVTISGVTGPLSDDPSDYNGQFPIIVTGPRPSSTRCQGLRAEKLLEIPVTLFTMEATPKRIRIVR